MSDKKISPIRLANIPSDVKEYILELQGIEQKNCLCKKSQERVVYMIIREHKEMTDLEKRKKP